MDNIYAYKKIVIVGVSASGKSTFSKKLAKIVNIPVIFMDSIMWKPGWVYAGDEFIIEKLRDVSNNSEWIIEGYIKTEARKFLFEKADLIIYLDYSRIIPAWRYIKRFLMHRKNARPELEGSPEKFSFKFLKIVWMKWETVALDELSNNLEDKQKIIKLRSPKEAEMFLVKNAGPVKVQRR
jgi:adenylate kinase family enzyme